VCIFAFRLSSDAFCIRGVPHLLEVVSAMHRAPRSAFFCLPCAVGLSLTIGLHKAPSLPQTTTMSAPNDSLTALRGTEYCTVACDISALEMDISGDMKQA
jgi:hypothetical protein